MPNIQIKDRFLYYIINEDIRECEEYLRNNNVDLNVIIYDEDEHSRLDGHTYLTYVVARFIKKESNEFIDLLIKYGADVNFKNISATTPLIWAGAGTISTVEKLLNYGANINDVNDDNASSLLVATQFQNLNTIRYLLEKGADPTIVSTKGFDFIEESEGDVTLWLSTFEIQKMLITQYPMLYKSFKNKGILHNGINKIFEYLNTTDELGLI